MRREEFFAKLAGFDEDSLRKVVWTLYWQGSAQMRERIEAQVDPDARAKQAIEPPVDPVGVAAEVGEFVTLARSGAYLAGDRRVSPKERSRWRFTFRRLADDAQRALADVDVGTAAAAFEQLIDLACDTYHFEYFRSEEPLVAARFVVSDAVALLWARLREAHGFTGFAERAAPQLIRWESQHGWTRSGDNRVSEQETSLAAVLAPMLRAADMWVGFARHYVDGLDRLADGSAAAPRRPWQRDGFDRERRSGDLAGWHAMLLERLPGSDAEELLDRIAAHPALGGAELTFLQARLAHQRGEIAQARELAHDALTKLPGHRQMLGFASQIGAPLPARAREIVEQRSR
jgi:hypothetical protein